MLSSVSKTVVAAAGGVAAAFGSALCCAGPLIAVSLGLSSAGFAATFEPLRPYFIGATVASLGSGFFIVRREERKACEPGKPCAAPEARHRMKVLLWVATILSTPLVTFPWWSAWLLG